MILIRTCGAFYKFRISLYSIFFLFNELSELELIIFFHFPFANLLMILCVQHQQLFSSMFNHRFL